MYARKSCIGESMRFSMKIMMECWMDKWLAEQRGLHFGSFSSGSVML
jgi:hypothetical protein